MSEYNPEAVAAEPDDCVYFRIFHSERCMVIPLAISPQNNHDEDRRKFLASCGRFAAVTPPTITLLLSTSLTSDAIASSSGHNSQGGNNQGGNSQGQNNNNQGQNN